MCADKARWRAWLRVAVLLMCVLSVWHAGASVDLSDSSIYNTGDDVVMLVGPLRSPRTLVPYAYDALPLCAAAEDMRQLARLPRANMVGHMFVPRIQASRYNFTAIVHTRCELACIATFTPAHLRLLHKMVREGYHMQLHLGNSEVIYDNRSIDSDNRDIVNEDDEDDDDEENGDDVHVANNNNGGDGDNNADDIATIVNDDMLTQLKEQLRERSGGDGIPLGYLGSGGSGGAGNDTTLTFYNHYHFTVYYNVRNESSIDIRDIAVRASSLMRPRCVDAATLRTAAERAARAQPRVATTSPSLADEAAAAAPPLRPPRTPTPWPREPLRFSVAPADLAKQPPMTAPITYSVQWVAIEGSLLGEVKSYMAPEVRRHQTMWHMTTMLYLLLLIFVASACVAVAVSRTVHRDFVLVRSRGGVRSAGAVLGSGSGGGGRDDDNGDDALLPSSAYGDEVGWRLVSGDVFRRPEHATLLCALVAGGAQVLLMLLLVYAAMLLNAVRRTHKSTSTLGLLLGYFASSGLCGWVCARMLVFVGVTSLRTALCASFLLPLSLTSLFVTQQLVYVVLRSGSAMALRSTLAVCIAWLALSSASAALGVVAGFRAPAVRTPCKISSIPRLIPVQQRHQRLTQALLYGGALLPFAVFSVELKFLLGLLWKGTSMTLLGVVAIISIEVFFFCAELSIAMTYTMLRAENYHWWWRSFNMHAVCGVYVFAYSVYFMHAYLPLTSTISVVLYLLYSASLAALCALLMGAISFAASAAFVFYLYSNTKVA